MLRASLAVALLLVTFRPAPAQEPPEHEAIRKAALDYVEGWYAADAERMARSLHPELAKRILRTNPETGKSYVDQMGATRLVEGTRAGGGSKTPEAERQKDVFVLDVFGSAATAKAVMSGWVDYMHLVKVEGRWLIVNVLWELKPEKP